MPQLPRAGQHQHHNLRKTIPHRLRVCLLAQIPKVRLALTLILLLSPDILKLLVQVAQFRGELRDMRAVVLSVRFRASNDDVEVETDVGGGGPGVAGGGRETDGVVSGLVRGEGEAAVVWSASFDDVVAGGEFL